MTSLRYLRHVGAFCLALLVAAGVGSSLLERAAEAQGAPAYRNIPLWPRPFADDSWILGSVTGVATDAQNHVWVAHRGNESLEANERGMIPVPGGQGQPSSSVCCMAAPYILEYAADGRLISSWGGRSVGYQWPLVTGGIAVDAKGNVWIAAAGSEPAPAGRGRGAAPPPESDLPTGAPAARGAAPARGAAAAAPPADAHVLKFGRDGRYILTIGTPGKMEGPDSHTTLNRPSAIAVDSSTNEVFVADMGNRRVVVFDAENGAYKRHWFAYGEKTAGPAPGRYNLADPPARSFRDMSCIEIARDGMVYVCDKDSNRIQVFDKSGKFVKEGFVAKNTLGGVIAGTFGVINAAGAVWDVAFSQDAQQRYLFVADGVNKKVRILLRDNLTEVGSIGSGGRYPGQFLIVNSVAVDSDGNLYTGETHHGKRVQKFAPGK